MKYLIPLILICGCYAAGPIGNDTADTAPEIDFDTDWGMDTADTAGTDWEPVLVDTEGYCLDLGGWHADRCLDVFAGLPNDCQQAAMGGDLDEYLEACGADVLYLRVTE